MCSACSGGWDGEPDLEPLEEEQLCEECGHKLSLHENKYGCDYEADRYEPDFGPVAWRCGCKFCGVGKAKGDAT
jgi:hypothetical protein